MGLGLIVLPPDERYPDSCFTQDPALVLEGRALIGRPGVASRAGEAEELAAVLGPLVGEMERVEPPGTVEGGDIVRIGKQLAIGLSRRTNRAGVQAVARFASPLGYSVRTVPVPAGVLHLSTAVTVLSDELVMGRDEVLRDEAFAGLDHLPVGDAPLAACNVLAVGNRVIASGDYRVHDRLERRGWEVRRLDLSEFERADAGPTCLSLLIG